MVAVTVAVAVETSQAVRTPQRLHTLVTTAAASMLARADNNDDDDDDDDDEEEDALVGDWRLRKRRGEAEGGGCISGAVEAAPRCGHGRDALGDRGAAGTAPPAPAPEASSTAIVSVDDDDDDDDDDEDDDDVAEEEPTTFRDATADDDDGDESAADARATVAPTRAREKAKIPSRVSRQKTLSASADFVTHAAAGRPPEPVEEIKRKIETEKAKNGVSKSWKRKSLLFSSVPIYH